MGEKDTEPIEEDDDSVDIVSKFKKHSEMLKVLNDVKLSCKENNLGACLSQIAKISNAVALSELKKVTQKPITAFFVDFFLKLCTYNNIP